MSPLFRLIAALLLPVSLLRAAEPLPSGARLRLGSAPFRHSGEVDWLQFLPDGKTLLSSARDGHVRFWDATGREVRPALPIPSSFRAAVAPDGKTFAVTSTHLHVFDATGKEIRDISNGSMHLVAAAFSPDGKTLAAHDVRRTIRIYDAATWTERKVLGTPITDVGERWPQVPPRLAFSPDGRTLAAGEEWAYVLYDLEGNKPPRWLGGHAGPVVAAAFTPDGRRLVTAAEDDAGRVWDVATGQTVATLAHDTPTLRAFALSADGSTAAFAGRSPVISLCRVADGARLRSLEVPAFEVHALAFAPDGRSLFVGSSDRIIRTYEVATGREIGPPSGHVRSIHALAFAPDGKTLATAGDFGSEQAVVLWDAEKGTVRRRLTGHRYGTTLFAFARDGKTLHSFGHDRHVRTWDVDSGRETAAFCAAATYGWVFAFSPDRRHFAFFGKDKLLRVWDVAREEERPPAALKFQGRGTYGTRLTFAPDWESFWILGQDRFLRRWNAESNESLKVGVPAPSDKTDLLVSADGRSLAFASVPTPVLFEAATGKERVRFEGAPPPEPWPPVRPRFEPRKSSPFDDSHIAWTPDGRTLATTARDGIVRFWDTGTGKMVAERAGPVGAATALAFRPDGRVLAVAHADATVLLWDVPGPDAPGRFVPTDDGDDRLWAALADDDAAKAYRAVRTLEALPERAVRLLGARLKPGETLRGVRAVEVLEALGTAEARRLLEQHAVAPDDVALKREARGALSRLGR